MRLYAESVQTKLDDSEFQRTELLETTKKLMTVDDFNNKYCEGFKKREWVTHYEIKIINGWNFLNANW